MKSSGVFSWGFYFWYSVATVTIHSLRSGALEAYFLLMVPWFSGFKGVSETEFEMIFCNGQVSDTDEKDTLPPLP